MFKGTLNGPRALLGALPTAAVFALLGFIAYEGHRHDWKWGETAPEGSGEKAAAPSDEDEEAPAPEPGDYGRSEFDATLTRSHNPDACRVDGREIKFKDADSVRKAGIRVGVVRERDVVSELPVTGTVDFDPTLVARVSPRASGILWHINKQVGDAVLPNEILAVVDSAEVGRAKANFLQAKVQLDLKTQLRARLQSGVSPESAIITADAAVREARVHLQTAYQALLNLGLAFPLAELADETDAELTRRLQFLGLPKEVADTLPGEATNNLIAVRNPLPRPAVVLQRNGVQCESVPAGQQVFVVGDVSRMVLLLNVRQEDARTVQRGMPLEFRTDGSEGEPVAAKVEWVGAEIDPKTRTVTVRALVDNPGGWLKAGAFGKASIVRSKSRVPCVPEEAVQWEGCCHVVFVREKPGEFEARKVKLGLRHGGYIEVLDGVKPGDVVAVQGSHVLKSELFRDRLGTAEE